MQQVAVIDEDVLERFGVDTRQLSLRPARPWQPLGGGAFVDEWVLDGKRVFILGEGRLINLAAAEGHPASVMDLSFANQALAAEHLVHTGGSLSKAAPLPPPRIDPRVGQLNRPAMGSATIPLPPRRDRTLAPWGVGT